MKDNKSPLPVLFNSHTHTSGSCQPRELKAGQIWLANGRYIHISELGKKLVHFRMLKTPTQKSAAVDVTSKQELLAHLEKFSAELFQASPEAQADV